MRQLASTLNIGRIGSYVDTSPSANPPAIARYPPTLCARNYQHDHNSSTRPTADLKTTSFRPIQFVQLRPAGRLAGLFFNFTGFTQSYPGVWVYPADKKLFTRGKEDQWHDIECADRFKILVRVLDDCDRLRFAPGSGEAPAREAMLGRADQVINELEAKA